uniref:Uncharacterized protein n=1 Tax=Anguilla anguilla TaxID=7936 RepID=A0A0E9T3W8_ANGAN
MTQDIQANVTLMFSRKQNYCTRLDMEFNSVQCKLKGVKETDTFNPVLPITD